MIEINPNAFYTRPDLIELFKSAGADWDTIRARILPAKVHHDILMGQHILDAYAASGTTAAPEPAPAPKPKRTGRTGKRGGELIDQALESVRGKRK